MNSVLQALLHTPPLRNYFLSDKHNRYFCQRRSNADGGDSGSARKRGGGNSGNKNARICLACDMDAMFSAVFSGDRVPYSPAKFLYRCIGVSSLSCKSFLISWGCRYKIGDV